MTREITWTTSLVKQEYESVYIFHLMFDSK